MFSWELIDGNSDNPVEDGIQASYALNIWDGRTHHDPTTGARPGSVPDPTWAGSNMGAKGPNNCSFFVEI